MPRSRHLTRRRFLELGIGAAGVVTVGPGMWLPVARAVDPEEGDGKVIFRSGFEPGDAGGDAPRHRVVEGVARSGKRSLQGEATGPNQASIVKIPFESPPSQVLRISFWVRSDKRSTAAAFVRVGKRRDRLGTLKGVSSSKWVRAQFSYPVAARTEGVIEIVAPSSYGAPAGRMWIDDVTVTLVPDACEWPAHVQDFPELAADCRGVVWMAAVERPVPRRLVRVYRIDANGPVPVCTIEPAGITGIGAPAIAGAGDGCVVAFPFERAGKWGIAYAFVPDGDGKPGKLAPRVIEGGGTSNVNPALASTGDATWLLWETNAGDARGINACRVDPHGYDQLLRLSSPDENSYNPAVVALDDGTLFAAWDSCRSSHADIHGAWCVGGRWGTEGRITSDARIERHPHLAARDGKVWMAWQAQSYAGIRLNQITEQRIAVARLDGMDDGRGGVTGVRLAAPKGFAKRFLARGARGARGGKLMRPRIGVDNDGRLWLTARRSLGMQSGWEPLAWCSGAGEWRGPVGLVHRSGRWRPVAVACGSTGPVAAMQFDDLPDTWREQGVHVDWRSGVLVKRLAWKSLPPARTPETERLEMPATDFSLAERADLVAAALPRQRVRHGGAELALWWGDFHDHTDLSVCCRQVNPPGHDLFANERDIERLDFVALTDHGYNFDPPQWQLNGEQTRAGHDPGRFVTFLGQEWTSSRNPPTKPGGPNRYGHHNIVFLDPYHERFHDSYDGDISPRDLWKKLGGAEFLCIPHQLADWKMKGKGNPPTDWSHHDERLRPVAEIFQARKSYEYLGCPRQAPDGAPFAGHYLQDVWAKGVVVGVIASPDHGGGMGKVGVWAPELTRRAIFDAVRARHTFGTSGAKMSLFLRSADWIMGDVAPRRGGAISFEVHARAMREIRELVIFRGREVAFRSEPGRRELNVKWTDPAPPEGRLWYYARIHAADDELAWSSPIWFA